MTQVTPWFRIDFSFTGKSDLDLRKYGKPLVGTRLYSDDYAAEGLLSALPLIKSVHVPAPLDGF